MNDNPSKVNVLYGKVESKGLQRIADETVKYFVDHKLAKTAREPEHVKMHMTLINTGNAFFKIENGQKKRRRSRPQFDGRSILEKFANFEFGSQEVNHIHLALRRSKGSDGFYVLISSIEF